MGGRDAREREREKQQKRRRQRMLLNPHPCGNRFDRDSGSVRSVMRAPEYQRSLLCLRRSNVRAFVGTCVQAQRERLSASLLTLCVPR